MKFPPPLIAGSPVVQTGAGLLLIHGRGGSAEAMIELYKQLRVHWCTAIALQAPGHSWYPHSFLAPLEENQPYLDAALGHIESVVTDLMEREVPSEEIALLGFSQGACLAVEFAARFPRRYGGICALTGGLIGPPGTPRNYRGSLQGTPVFLGAGDPDPHVPFARVRETNDVLCRLGASVDIRRYPGMDHTINAEELYACRDLLKQLAPGISKED